MRDNQDFTDIIYEIFSENIYQQKFYVI